MAYTYGTNPIAAKRLQRIANFFNPHAEDFIRSYWSRDKGICIDLGCGPGYSTEMLYKATGKLLTYGLDQSKDYIQTGKENYSHLKFIRQDVTQPPFLIKADLFYTRNLLVHQTNPEKVLINWISEINSNGIIFVEEIESIESKVDAFSEYLTMNDRMLGENKQGLFIGKCLSDTQYPAEILYNEAIEIPVPNYEAAAWFYPNTQTIWKENHFFKQNYPISTMTKLELKIKEILDKEDQTEETLWRIRRIVLKK